MGIVSGNHIFLFIIFLVIVLVIFGPGKLPDVGSGMGKAIREFRKATSDVKDGIHQTVSGDTSTVPSRPAVDLPAGAAGNGVGTGVSAMHPVVDLPAIAVTADRGA